MKPTNASEVLDLIGAHAPAAALGAALELGLFPALATDWREPGELGLELGVSEPRCRYWLQMIEDLGLAESDAGSFRISARGREAILDAHPAGSWSFFARSEREMLGLYQDLPDRLRRPASEWRDDCRLPPDYVKRMGDDPAWAESFTRMLRDLHENLAAALAARLPGDGVRRFMDLGGGSGVMSHALLRAWPSASAVLVDIPAVAAIAETIAREAGLDERIKVVAVSDITKEALPSGPFDLILECDLSVHDADLFAKLGDRLRCGGRLVLVDQFAPTEGVAPPDRLQWRFQGALLDRAYETPTVDRIRSWLVQAGFEPLNVEPLKGYWTLIVAEKP